MKTLLFVLLGLVCMGCENKLSESKAFTLLENRAHGWNKEAYRCQDAQVVKVTRIVTDGKKASVDYVVRRIPTTAKVRKSGPDLTAVCNDGLREWNRTYEEDESDVFEQDDSGTWRIKVRRT